MIYKLLIKAPDQKGLVYKISKLLYEYACNIEQQNEFVDKETGIFYLRTEFSSPHISVDELKSQMQKELGDGSEIDIHNFEKKNIVIMVTKESHAIGDLLIKHQSSELNANIKAVIGNHDTLRRLVEKFGIPFHHISHQGLTKEAYEQKMHATLSTYEMDILVLAKYMRILSPHFVERYKHKIINIHHSFLPAFIGQNPYKQAFDRGVKIIGATAHYVTSDLDEGPIIAQDVMPINHRYSAEKMREYGKNIETIVLTSALKLALDDQIFIDGNKTIILN